MLVGRPGAFHGVSAIELAVGELAEEDLGWIRNPGGCMQSVGGGTPLLLLPTVLIRDLGSFLLSLP